MDFERNATIYSSQKATSKKNDDDSNKWKKEESKSDGYILSPHLRQRVENL